LAVNGTRKSINAAYLASQEDFTVSVTSLYKKLQGVETQVSRALVCESSVRLAPVIREMRAQTKPLLPGYRAKIIDGKHLNGTEHRLKETHTINSKPLPGHSLVVLDPRLRLLIDVLPCEDAYAQERSLLPDVLKTVMMNDLWIADRNFCTNDFLFGIADLQAAFLIRQHGSTLSGKELIGHRRRIGRCETGTVYEQILQICNNKAVDPPAEVMKLRRITIELDKPTRNGDDMLHIVTNVPKDAADAITLAQLYRERWSIESAFQELGQALNAEINTLCYPKAALLALCVALFTYNVMSAMKAAIRIAHRSPSLLMDLSGYYLAEEIAAIYGGMVIAIEPRYWTKAFANLTIIEFAQLLTQLATNVDVSRFKKNKRGPKHPPPKRTGGLREKHVSTKRLLDKRHAKKQPT
jgi:IS4 transposase